MTMVEPACKSMERLDIMVAYSCNLGCQGCISLSDFNRDGIAPLNDVVDWCHFWSKLIDPKVITLFGGEPCLHPHLIEICNTIRQCWPDCTLRLITNGYLLDNFPAEAWFDFAPFEMQVSIHRADHESVINQKIKKVLSCRDQWHVQQDPRSTHQKLVWSLPGIKIYKSWFREFIVPYRYTNEEFKPWNSNPTLAHKVCGAPSTPVLYKGKLYKCPAVANTIDLSNENWFNYQACSGADTLDEFVNSIGVAESVCGQCPELSQAVIIDHFDKKNVRVKQKNIS
jgi:hypothetical protein